MYQLPEESLDMYTYTYNNNNNNTYNNSPFGFYKFRKGITCFHAVVSNMPNSS